MPITLRNLSRCAPREANPGRKVTDGAGRGQCATPDLAGDAAVHNLFCCLGLPGAELGSVGDGAVVCSLCTGRAGGEAPRRAKRVWNGSQILCIGYTWTFILVQAAESNTTHSLQPVNSLVWQAV